MTKKRFRAVAGAAVALWVALVPGGAAAQADAVLPAPVPVEARLTSALSDPYYVLTGPVETYRGYRLERRFGRLLESYARRKSGTGSSPLVLTVHLESLTTGYHQIGGRDRERRYRTALPRTGPELLLASASGPEGSLVRLRRFGGRDRDNGGPSIPYEITKRAVLTAVVAVATAGDSLARDTVTREAVEVISWDDYDRWAYDYGRVLEGAFMKVLAEADRLVDDAVAKRGP